MCENEEVCGGMYICGQREQSDARLCEASTLFKNDRSNGDLLILDSNRVRRCALVIDACDVLPEGDGCWLYQPVNLPAIEVLCNVCNNCDVFVMCVVYI